MLTRFTVENYRSFKNRTEFSMFPGAPKLKQNHLIKNNDLSVLKFAAIYGANAAGKSNLIKSITTAKNLIVNGIGSIGSNEYFKLDDKMKYHPSSFEFEFIMNKKNYAYGFNIDINKQEFLGEWLYELSREKEYLIFERDLINNTFKKKNFIDEKAKLRFEIFNEAISSDKKCLLINEMNRNKGKLFEEYDELRIFNDIYKWFSNTLEIEDKNLYTPKFEVLCDENNNVIKLLEAFNIGISDYKFVEADDLFIEKAFKKKGIPNEILREVLGDIKDKMSKEDCIRNKKKYVICSNNELYRLSILDNDNIKIETVVFEHSNKKSINFLLEDESDGTKRIIDLLKILLSKKEKVFVIDEIERSLHPNLTYKFIELFLEHKNNSQLIITTHEDRLMDLNLLRRDEIWLAEKDKYGSTKLITMESYQPRFDKRILKAYLEGRFGGIPKLKSIDKLTDF